MSTGGVSNRVEGGRGRERVEEERGEGGREGREGGGGREREEGEREDGGR